MSLKDTLAAAKKAAKKRTRQVKPRPAPAPVEGGGVELGAPPEEGVKTGLADLQAQVAALQAQVATLGAPVPLNLASDVEQLKGALQVLVEQQRVAPPETLVLTPPALWPVPDLDTFVAWCRQSKNTSAKMIAKHGHSWTSPVMRALLALQEMQKEQQQGEVQDAPPPQP